MSDVGANVAGVGQPHFRHRSSVVQLHVPCLRPRACVLVRANGQAAQLAPKTPQKKRTCLSQAPAKRGVCASLSPSLSLSPPPSRSLPPPPHHLETAGLLPVDATHVAAVPSTPATVAEPPMTSFMPSESRPPLPPASWPKCQYFGRF
jgi:hypothetical protein